MSPEFCGPIFFLIDCDFDMPGQRDETPISTLEAWELAPGKLLWVGGNNVHARGEVEALLPPDTERPPAGPIELAVVTPQSADEAVYFAKKLRFRLERGSRLWVVFPKFGTPREGEFSGNLDEMAIALFELGFTESRRASVGEEYTSTGYLAGESML